MHDPGIRRWGCLRWATSWRSRWALSHPSHHREIRRAHAGGSVQGGWVGRIFNGASYREGRACIHTRVCKMGGRACV